MNPQSPREVKKVTFINSLSTKISLVNALIILVSFSAILMTIIYIDKALFIQQEERMMNVYISNSLNTVDSKLRDMGRVSLICFSDDRTQEIIRDYDQYTYLDQQHSESYLEGLFTSLIKMRDDIRGVYIFDESQLIFHQDSTRPSLKRDYDIAAYIDDFITIDEDARKVAGCRLVIDALPEFARYNKTPFEKENAINTIYMVRSISSFSPHELIGYSILIAPIEKIKDLLEEYLEPNTSYMLMTEEGQVVSSDDKTLIGKNLEQIDKKIHENMTTSEGVFWHDINGANTMFLYQQSEYSGLYLMTLKTEEVIQKNLRTFAKNVVGVGMLVFLTTTMLMMKVTSMRLTPIKRLSTEMSGFSQSKMHQRYEVVSSDETGQLVDSFNYMMDMIVDLIEKEFESKVKLQETQMLQQKSSLMYLKNQINQHFLYNTLDTIRIKAELNDDKEVSYMIMQLVIFFRRSINVENQLVSIGNEIELMKAYLKLINCRYPNVSAVYEIDESLTELMIPNFVLQPLVENCVLHGLKGKGYKGIIRLSVHRDPTDTGYILMSLYDNGVGFTDETYHQMQTMLKELKVDLWGTDGNGDSHIGVMNIEKRLKTFYKSASGLIFERNQEGGVTVTIRFPEKMDGIS